MAHPGTRHTSPPHYTAERIPLPAAKLIVPIGLNDDQFGLFAESRCTSCNRTYYLSSAGSSAVKVGVPDGALNFQPVGIGPNQTFAGVAQYPAGADPVMRSFLGHVVSGSVQFSPLLDPDGGTDGVEALFMDSQGDVLGRGADDP